MNHRRLGFGAFALGLAAVAWVAWGYLGSSPLALTMTLLIGAVYAAGALELWRFHQASAGLRAALAALPEQISSLADWLIQLPGPLQQPVRQRIEGERAALPGPALAPYLVGLLVLLGMLGTFLGMVVTLNGAVLALESTTDLATIRAALAAPVKGLGLAFGTSVAGVAASAMLGLVAALCRRERLLAALALDARIATRLRAFSRAHQREATLEALQSQARQMPALVDQLQALMAGLDQRHQALGERLTSGQDRFHQQAEAAYTGLASSVGHSLQHSLGESARLASAGLQPLAQATLDALAHQSAALQQQTLAALAQAQARQRSDADLQDQQRLAAWTASLASTAAELQQGWRQGWQQAGAQALGQQQQILQTLQQTAQHLQAQADAQGRSLLAELSRLTASAAQAPQAAAELVGQLRQQLSDSLARDTGLLDERSRIMATLSTLLEAVTQAATGQRQAIDTLVAGSTGLLEQAGTRFGAAVDAQSTQLTTLAAQIGGSAVDMASLGEAFGAAVQQYGQSNQALVGQLQRIEAALGKSTARSDEQLAYYVAQAREIIDLSLSSQQQIVDELQRLARRPALALGEALGEGA